MSGAVKIQIASTMCLYALMGKRLTYQKLTGNEDWDSRLAWPGISERGAESVCSPHRVDQARHDTDGLESVLWEW